MDDIRVGSHVRWAQTRRDRPHARIRKNELFTVQKVYANGRCDLIDGAGAELFSIPTRHLQLLESGIALTKKT